MRARLEALLSSLRARGASFGVAKRVSTRSSAWWEAGSAWWSRQTALVRAGSLASGIAGLGLLVVGLVVLAGALADGPTALAGAQDSGGEAPSATATAASTGTATGTPRATRTPTRTPTPAPTPTEEPPVRSIQELTAEFGEPPDATFGRFRIPALGVDAPLGVRSVGSDGTMPNPTGPADVVWYDFNGWDGYGGAPGAGGNAVFSGHVDYAAYVAYAGVNFRGRGVFFDLRNLSPGDVIEVVVNGQTLTYQVAWREQVSASGGEWGSLMSANVGGDSITLITCGGDFNFATREYSDRTVVRATRI